MSESLIRSLLDKKRAICSDIKWANSQPCQRAHIWKFAPHCILLLCPYSIYTLAQPFSFGKIFGWPNDSIRYFLIVSQIQCMQCVVSMGKNLKLKQKKKMKKYFFKGFVSKLINTLFGRSVHFFMNFFSALVLKTIVAQMLF